VEWGVPLVFEGRSVGSYLGRGRGNRLLHLPSRLEESPPLRPKWVTSEPNVLITRALSAQSNTAVSGSRRGLQNPFVRVRDFINRELGKADTLRPLRHRAREVWVSVGVDHDTAEFAVAALERSWRGDGQERGPRRHPTARHRRRRRQQLTSRPSLKSRVAALRWASDLDVISDRGRPCRWPRRAPAGPSSPR
jgi:hypothetical protein